MIATVMTSPSVCIIVLNWNGYSDTVECLNSLSNLDYDNFQVVVVDNGSKNDEADKIADNFPWATLLRNKENLGFSGGCNTGLRYATNNRFDYVLLFNNDAVATPDFLGRLVDFYETSKDAGIVSPVILYGDQQTVWSSGARVDPVLGVVRMDNKGRNIADVNLGDTPYVTEFAVGACILIGVKFLRQLGGLDDLFFVYYEDVDLGYRARRYGRESYVVPTATVYHKKSAATGSGGKSRFTRTPAYYIARNGILFSRQMQGWRRWTYVIAQYTTKPLLSMLLLVEPIAWGAYVRGIIDGTKLGIAKTKSDVPRFS